MIEHLDATARRGSKYLVRRLLSLRHFRLSLKQLGFAPAKIERIGHLKHEFERAFADNLREINSASPNAPPGFDHRRLPQPGERRVHEDFWRKDMTRVGSLMPAQEKTGRIQGPAHLHRLGAVPAVRARTDGAGLGGQPGLLFGAV